MNIKKMIFLLWSVASTLAVAQDKGWDSVEKILGRKGAVQNDIEKITFPRSDLNVVVGNVHVEPGLALTSWVAMKRMGSGVMVMGDLVLLEKELPPVEAKLLSNGLTISAIHNHLINEEPKVMYMHIAGEGDADNIAESIKQALSLTGTLINASPSPSVPAADIDWSGVDSTLGVKGKRVGNLLQIGVPRPEKIMENGMEVPPYMGMAISINFQRLGTSSAITGDFVLLADEVPEVLKALHANGITATALHSHMLNESPRLFFMHFWAVDDPVKLARGLRAALDKTRRQ